MSMNNIDEEVPSVSAENAAERVVHELVPQSEEKIDEIASRKSTTPQPKHSTLNSQLEPTFFGSDDMPDEMKEACVAAARTAIKLKTNRERAEYLKKFFDKTYNQNGQGKWHCIVGTDFGSYITHESQNFLFFRLGAYYILIFKA